MEDGINQNTVHGNFVNQRLLKPVHDWLMAVLRKLPTDGTFKRHPYPIGQTCCHCFDLKSATDRRPLCLMFEVMCHLFDRSFASEMVNSALETHIFCVPLVPYFFLFLLNLKWYASSGSFGATPTYPPKTWGWTVLNAFQAEETENTPPIPGTQLTESGRSGPGSKEGGKLFASSSSFQDLAAGHFHRLSSLIVLTLGIAAS